MENQSKRKLEEILENLEKKQSNKSENWKLIIEQNKEKFDQIKMKIKQKQEELANLVKKKKAILISDSEFNEKTQIIQHELYELESQILKLRLQIRKL
ncbi:MAG: hypothetical protein ACFFD2_28825 [Promethearchaeota archaeon]